MIKNIYYWKWNSGIIRNKDLFLENNYNTSFELFSIHIWKGYIEGIVIFITIFNFTWTVAIDIKND